MRSRKDFNIIADNNHIVFYQINGPRYERFIRCFSKIGKYKSAYHGDVPHSFSLEELDKTRWPFKFNMGDTEMAEDLKASISLLKKEDLNKIPFWVKSLIILYELKK